jgi:hypothetical protein
MVTMAPRIRPALIEAIIRLDDRRLPIAEVYRRVAAEAESLGLTRPSYQRIRELVHEVRNRRPRMSVSDVINLLYARPRHPEDGIRLMMKLGVRPIPDLLGFAPASEPP